MQLSGSVISAHRSQMVLPQIYLVPLVTIRPRQRGHATDLHRPGSLPHCYPSGLPEHVTTANVAAMFRALDVPARRVTHSEQPAGIQRDSGGSGGSTHLWTNYHAGLLRPTSKPLCTVRRHVRGFCLMDTTSSQSPLLAEPLSILFFVFYVV